MLTDKPQLKSRKSPKKQNLARQWYSDSQKLEAVKLWLVTGNLAATAATLDIPLDTIKYWRYSKWWEELVSEIRTEGTLQLSNKLKGVAEKALGVTLDRLDNGDWIMNQKTGVLERKPVAMRDAYQVLAGTLDRALDLDKKPESDVNQQKVQDRLEALAKAFEKFAGKIVKPEIIDVEPKEISDGQEGLQAEEKGEVDAVHEGREEGLQEGTPVGEDQEAQPSEGSSEADSGPEGDGEDLGGQAEFDACGPQEALEVGRFKLSEQLAVDEREGKSD